MLMFAARNMTGDLQFDTRLSSFRFAQIFCVENRWIPSNLMGNLIKFLKLLANRSISLN